MDKSHNCTGWKDITGKWKAKTFYSVSIAIVAIMTIAVTIKAYL